MCMKKQGDEDTGNKNSIKQAFFLSAIHLQYLTCSNDPMDD